jgi:hypothetical protein
MIPIPKPVVVHEVEGSVETVLCDVSGARLLVLNDLGAAVWYLIDGERTLDEIVDVIVTETGIERARAADDVRAYLASLESHGVIECQP